MSFAMQNFMIVAVAENTMLAASVRILSKPAHSSKPTRLSFARKKSRHREPFVPESPKFLFLAFEAVYQVGARWTANSLSVSFSKRATRS